MEPIVGAKLTASDNAGLGFSTAGRDLVFDAVAGVRVRSEGARLSLVGNASVESVSYARHTQGDDIIPFVDLTGRLVAVERFFYIEAGIRTTQSLLDPFGPALSTTTTNNNTTATQYRLTPYIDSEVTPNLHFRARSDNVKTRDYADSSSSSAIAAVDGSYLGVQTISLERDPRPFGWRLEGERDDTRYTGFAPLVSDFVRLLGNLAFLDNTATAGLRVGAERHSFRVDPGGEGWQPIYGGQASWRPSERTTLALDGEHRFFGNAVHLTFTHRMPYLSWNLNVGRDLDTTPRELLNLPPTANVAALLDSILTTRIPNPADRETQVQNIIQRQGLPASTANAITVLSPNLSITEGASLGVALLGVRNTLALTMFASRRHDALESGPLATGQADTNNQQRGATLAYALRLGPTTTAGTTLNWTDTRSLDTATLTEHTKEGSLRAQLAFQLAPKTATTFGGIYRKLASNVSIPGREASVFAALDHRF